MVDKLRRVPRKWVLLSEMCAAPASTVANVNKARKRQRPQGLLLEDGHVEARRIGPVVVNEDNNPIANIYLRFVPNTEEK